MTQQSYSAENPTPPTKPKVRSVKWFGPKTLTGRVWLVTKHPNGPRRFPSWQQAMDYALALTPSDLERYYRSLAENPRLTS